MQVVPTEIGMALHRRSAGTGMFRRCDGMAIAVIAGLGKAPGLLVACHRGAPCAAAV
ncbi:hypothetical protein PsSCT_31830 [Pseudomonas sp. SCT]